VIVKRGSGLGPLLSRSRWDFATALRGE